MRNFEPVRTCADLETLDKDQIVQGYLSAERGDPEPGENRGRSFWHGWRNRMIDLGELPKDDAAMQLAKEVLADMRAERSSIQAGHP
jgi:hypothetical protein